MKQKRMLLEGLERRVYLSAAPPVTQTQAVHVGPFPPSNAPGTFTFPQFDDQGGARKLTSVTLTLTLTSEGGATGLTNLGTDSGNATVGVGTDVNLVRGNQAPPNNVWDLQLQAQQTAQGFIGPWDGVMPPDFAPPDGITVIGTTAGDSQTKLWTDPTDLASFLGAGSVSFFYQSSPNNFVLHDIGGGPVVSFSDQATGYTLDGEITYVFDQLQLTLIKGVVATNGPGQFTQTPGPVPFTAPGSAGPLAGVINDTNADAVPVDANLANAHGGDRASFAIVLENITQGINAFDVRLTDTLPEGMSIPKTGLNLFVTDGTGAPLNFTLLGGGLFDPNGGIELTDPGPTNGPGQAGTLDPYDATSGRNIAVITYDLVVDHVTHEVPPRVDVATVYHAAGSEGGPNAIPNVSDPAWVTVRPSDIPLYVIYGGIYEIQPTPPPHYQPMYSGPAEPGSTLAVDVYAPGGDLIYSTSTMADAGGNWMVNFPDPRTLRDPYAPPLYSGLRPLLPEPTQVVVRQTFAGYDAGAGAGYNLRFDFWPGFAGGTHFSQSLTIQDVAGQRTLATSLGALYAASLHPLSAGWHLYSYEFLANPAVAAGY